MGLITSAAQAQAVRQQGEGADSRVSSRDNAFRNVLKNGISGAAQDMDATVSYTHLTLPTIA